MEPTLRRYSKPANPLDGLRVLASKRFVPEVGRVSLPDPSCDIVVVRGRAWLLGPMTKGQPTRHPGEIVTLLQTHPLVIREWLGAPLSELADLRVPLDELRPHATEALLEVLASDGLKRSPAPIGAHSRLSVAARALRRGANVKAAAAQVHLSERQLERRFLDAFGMPPKRFAQVIRFRRAVLAVGGGARLAEAASAHGYADQAHFARAARSLTGRTLRELAPHVGFLQERAVEAG